MAKNFFATASHSAVYAACRPKPSSEIMSHLIGYCKEKNPDLNTAIDVGCGSGQLTQLLSPFFKKIIGYDVSETQVTEARKINTKLNVSFDVSVGEKMDQITDASVDLVTCCQSFHWMNQGIFIPEVKRILKKNGVFAIVSYQMARIEGTHDQLLIRKFYKSTELSKYWLRDERKSIDQEFPDLKLPLDDLKRVTCLEVKVSDVNVSGVIGYCKSWSAVQRILKDDLPVAQKILHKLKQDLMSSQENTDDPKFQLIFDYLLLMGRKTSD